MESSAGNHIEPGSTYYAVLAASNALAQRVGGALRAITRGDRQIDRPVLEVGLVELAREVFDGLPIARSRDRSRLGQRDRELMRVVTLDDGICVHLAAREHHCHQNDGRNPEIDQANEPRQLHVGRTVPRRRGSGGKIQRPRQKAAVRPEMLLA